VTQGWDPKKRRASSLGYIHVSLESRDPRVVAYRPVQLRVSLTSSAALGCELGGAGRWGHPLGLNFTYQRQGGWRGSVAGPEPVVGVRRWKKQASSSLPIPHSPSRSATQQGEKGVWDGDKGWSGICLGSDPRPRETTEGRVRAWNLPYPVQGPPCRSCAPSDKSSGLEVSYLSPNSTVP
jgi:hypothetical protein